MKYLVIIFAFTFTLSTNVVKGQNDVDILNLAFQESGTTARNQSLGGVGGSLGADYSSFSSNPAGGALYRQSEMQFCLGLTSFSSNSNYLNNNTQDSKLKIVLPSLSYVGHNKTKKNTINANGEQVRRETGAFVWSIGYNQLSNFNRSYTLEGVNKNNSYLDVFAENANAGGGTSPNDLAYFFPFDADLAYQTNVLIPDSNNTNFYTAATINSSPLQQATINERGANNEIVFGIAGNFNNKIYLGASLCIPNINYTQASIFSELNTQNETTYFRNFRYNQNINMQGSGIGAKLGAIIRLNNYLRAGLAVHTPVVIDITDNYFTSMTSNTALGSSSAASQVENIVSYRVHTPAHFIASITALMPKRGFVSIDYELVNYNALRVDYNDQVNGFSFDEYETQLNAALDRKYKAASNLKIGVEYLIKSNTSLRLGYANYGSPIRKDNSVAGYRYNRNLLSAGFGYRIGAIKLDASIMYRAMRQYYRPYVMLSEPTEGAKINTGLVAIQLGVGVRF